MHLLLLIIITFKILIVIDYCAVAQIWFFSDAPWRAQAQKSLSYIGEKDLRKWNRFLPWLTFLPLSSILWTVPPPWSVKTLCFIILFHVLVKPFQRVVPQHSQLFWELLWLHCLDMRNVSTVFSIGSQCKHLPEMQVGLTLWCWNGLILEQMFGFGIEICLFLFIKDIHGHTCFGLCPMFLSLCKSALWV